MKVERISENQLKLTLTKDDLEERELHLEDLISPSEKTQKLFHDIMAQALDEYDFIGENTPLMVEAMPMGVDGITIIVTKVSREKGEARAASYLAGGHDLRRWKSKPPMIPDAMEEASDLLIYSFPTLDDVISVSLSLADSFRGESELYKNDGRFYLVLQADAAAGEEGDEAQDMEYILKEYGEKHVSTALARYYLLEHGETMIAQRAVRVLAKTFGE